MTLTQEELPNLYETLGLAKKASGDQIKKAYYKLALAHHPDRHANGNTEETTKLFQQIGFAYSILSDAKKRAYYDKTGNMSEELTLDFNDYSSSLSTNAIDEFKKMYVGSLEEKDDLLKAYTDAKGSLIKLLDSMFFADEEQLERYSVIIQDAINASKVKEYRAFKKDISKDLQKRKRLDDAEAIEAEQAAQQLGIDRESDLVALIQAKQTSRMDSFLDLLEEKYAKPKPKKAKASKK